MKNNKFIKKALVSSILGLIYSTPSYSIDIKYNANILVHQANTLIDPVGERIQFYNETIKAFNKGVAAKSDVKWAQEFMGIARPDNTPPAELSFILDGDPYFEVDTTFENLPYITLKGFLPLGTAQEVKDTVTFDYQIYSMITDELLATSTGEVSLWDSMEVPDGMYKIKMIVSNKDSSLETDFIDYIKINNYLPKIPQYTPVTKSDLYTHIVTSTKLEPMTTYHWLLKDSEGTLLEEVIEVTGDLEIRDSTAKFNMRGLPTGFYMIDNVSEDGFFDVDGDRKIFELMNYAPINKEFSASQVDYLSSTSDLILGEMDSVERGNKINININPTVDPEGASIDYGYEVLNSNGEVVLTSESRSTNYSVSTSTLLDGQYTISTYVSDGFNKVNSFFNEEFEIVSNGLEKPIFSILKTNPMEYTINIDDNIKYDFLNLKLETFITDIDGNILESLGTGYDTVWDSKAYGSGDYEVLVKLSNPEIPDDAYFLKSSFATQNEGVSITEIEGELVLHGFINTAPSAAPEIGTNFSSPGQVTFFVSNKIDIFDPEGISPLNYSIKVYEEGSDIPVLESQSSSATFNLESVAGNYYVVATVNDFRFTVSSDGTTVENPDITSENPIIPGVDQNIPTVNPDITFDPGELINLYDTTPQDPLKPSLVFSNAYDKKRISIPKFPVQNLDWGKVSEYKIEIFDSADQTPLKTFIYNATNPLPIYETWYWQPEILKDFSANVKLTITDDLGEIFESPIYTEEFINIIPPMSEIGYNLSNGVVELFGTTSTRQYNDITKYNLVIKDRAGTAVIQDLETVSDSTNASFDLSSLPDGIYNLEGRIKDDFKYSAFSTPVSLNIINSPLVTPPITYTYDNAGLLSYQASEPVQADVWNTDGDYKYFIEIKNQGTGEILVSSEMGLFTDGLYDGTLQTFSLESNVYEIYTKVIGNENPLVKSEYNTIFYSNSQIFDYTNLSPTTPVFDTNYLEKSLEAIITANPVSVDPENGVVTGTVEIIKNDDPLFSEIKEISDVINIDATLYEDGVYSLKYILSDAVGGVTNTINGTTDNIFTVFNQPPTAPELTISQQETDLIVYVSGALDYENKSLTYNLTLTSSDPLIEPIIVEQVDNKMFKVDLKSYDSDDFTIDITVSDGVKSSSNAGSFNYLNSIPTFPDIPSYTINDGILTITSNAVDNESPSIEYKATFVSPSDTPINFSSTNKTGVFKIPYGTLALENGLYTYSVLANDGFHEINQSLSIDLKNTSPELLSYEATQQNMMVTINAELYDFDNNLINTNIVIKDSLGNALQSNSLMGNKITDVWDATMFPSGEYLIDFMLDDGIDFITLNDQPFSLINGAPPQPSFSIDIKNFFDLTLNGESALDPEGVTIEYSYDLLDLDGNVLIPDFGTSQIATYDLETLETGSYKVVYKANDGVNFVTSKPETLNVQNEGPGTPIFNVIQDGYSLNIIGKDYIDPEGSQLTYSFRVENVDDINDFYEISGIESQITLNTEAWNDGRYSINLILSDGVNSSESPTSYVDTSNLDPLAPEIKIRVDKPYIDIDIVDVSDPEGMPITYNSAIYYIQETTVTNDVPTLDTNGDPVLDANGDPVTHVETTIIKNDINVYSSSKSEFLIPVTSLTGTNTYHIKTLTSDGVNTVESTGNFDFANTAPSKPSFTSLATLEDIKLTGDKAIDVNFDKVTHYYEFIYKNDGTTFVFNNLVEDIDNPSLLESDVLFTRLTAGNGEYLITYYASDSMDVTASDTFSFNLNYTPMIVGGNIYIDNYIEGIELDPGETISLSSDYEGNTDLDVVSYNWSVAEGSLSIIDTPDSNWTIPTSNGSHDITLRLSDQETSSFEIVKTINVKNYLPEEKDIVMNNYDGEVTASFVTHNTSTVTQNFWNDIIPIHSFTGVGDDILSKPETALDLGNVAYNPSSPDLVILEAITSELKIDLKQSAKPTKISMSIANIEGGTVKDYTSEYEVYYSYDNIVFTKLSDIIVYPGSFLDIADDSYYNYDNTYSYFPNQDPFTHMILDTNNTPVARFWKIKKKAGSSGTINNFKIYMTF